MSVSPSSFRPSVGAHIPAPPPEYYGAVTKRFAAVFPAEEYPSFQWLKGQVSHYVEHPEKANEGRVVLGEIGHSLSDGWKILIGKADKLSKRLFPSGHTYKLDTLEPGKHIGEELSRISKLPELERKFMIFLETSVLYLKAWGERLALMFARRI